MMSEKFVDKLSGWALDYAEHKGYKVLLKTDLGPEIQIYDSNAPASNGQALPIKYSVRVIDRNGKLVTGYGEPPKTNKIKAAVVVGGALITTYVLLTGVARILNL